jgi:hypothetical protein
LTQGMLPTVIFNAILCRRLGTQRKVFFRPLISLLLDEGSP